MAVTPEQWYGSMPVLTKVYFTVALAATILATFNMLNPYYLYLDFDLVTRKFQLWRLITNFCFFGKFSMPFIFKMFLLTRSMMNLEAGHFFGSSAATAEMAFLMLFGATFMIAFSYFWPFPFLGMSLIFMVLYVWSRKEPYTVVTFWGFAFQAWQYPFVLMVLGILLGGNPVLDILGIVIGHIFHFLTDVFPRQYGSVILKTPQFMYDLFERNRVHARASGWQRSTGHRLDE